MEAPCLYCPDGSPPLRFTGIRGWVHENGETYVGECQCDPAILTRSTGGWKHVNISDCPTWRDNHVATPRRS